MSEIEMLEKEFYELFRIRVKSRRLSKQISSEDTGDALGISHSQYRNLESGHSNFTFYKAYQVSRVLKMKLTE